MNFSDYVIYHTITDSISTFNPRKTWEHIIRKGLCKIYYSNKQGDRRIEYYPDSGVQTYYKYSSPSDW